MAKNRDFAAHIIFTAHGRFTAHRDEPYMGDRGGN